MVDLGTVGILAQAGTGLFIVLAGLVALGAASPRRHTVSFSIFLVLWGGLLLAGNLAGLQYYAGNLAQAEELLILQAVLQGIAFLPLVVFTLSYPPSKRIDLDRWPILLALLAPVIAVMLWALWDPSVFHQGFGGEKAVSPWGPGKAGVFFLFYLAMYAVLIRLVLVLEESTNDIERRQSLYVLLGFCLFVGYESIENAVIFSHPGLLGPRSLTVETGVFFGTSLAGLGMIGWVAYRLLRGPRSLTGTPRGLAVGCLAGSLLLGLLTSVSMTSPLLPQVPAESVWRVAAVALILSAMTRFERSRSEESLPTWMAGLGWFGVATVVLFTVHMGLTALLDSSAHAFGGLMATLLGAAILLAWQRPGTFGTIVRHLRRKRSPVAHARRDIEVYEAALLSNRPAPMLVDLRSTMSISTAEHEIMAQMTDPHAPSPLPSNDPPGLGDVLDDRYRLELMLGEGTSSRVYRARDLREDKDVAIKVLDPHAGSAGDVRRFVYEARVCLRLNHPNITDAYELGHVEGRPYLAFEFLEGGTLKSHIPEDGMPAEHAAAIVDGLLSGVQHLHDEGLVHRDLKPANILVDGDGNAKIADLGLADPWDAQRTQTMGPEAGLRQGTPAYMSPEALLGRPPSPKCDLYAVGAILVEMLTGSHYLGVEGMGYRAVKRAVLQHAPVLDEVDPELAAICRRALEDDPAKRYVSADEMREEILAVAFPARDTGYEMVLSEIVDAGKDAGPPRPEQDVGDEPAPKGMHATWSPSEEPRTDRSSADTLGANP